jgi:hypothetical protein
VHLHWPSGTLGVIRGVRTWRNLRIIGLFIIGLFILNVEKQAALLFL